MAFTAISTQKTTVAREKGDGLVVNFYMIIQVDSNSFAHMILSRPYLLNYQEQ